MTLFLMFQIDFNIQTQSCQNLAQYNVEIVIVYILNSHFVLKNQMIIKYRKETRGKVYQQGCNCFIQFIIFSRLMSDQEIKPSVKNENDDDDNMEGEQLFNQVQPEEDSGDGDRKLKKLKKKIHKKQKKSKKNKDKKKQSRKERRRKREEQDQQFDLDQDDEQQRNSMFDQQAESDNEEEYSEDKEAEIGQQDERGLFDEMINKPRYSNQYFKNLQGKNDRQINARYSRGANMIRENEAMYPGPSDPRVFMIQVMSKSPEQMAMIILNKAKHDMQDKNIKTKIVTATAMKKKYPGKVFVQARSQADVRQSLEGLSNLKLSKFQEIPRQAYAELFSEKQQVKKVDYQPSNFVRVTKGLYEGDLAQILKVKANSVDVIIVPRINVKEIAIKIKQRVSKMTDEALKKKKQEEYLNYFLNHKSSGYRPRPLKQIIEPQELYESLGNNPAVKKIKLVDKPPGLILLNYRFDEIEKPKGTYLPAEIMPFTTEGNIIGKMNEERSNLTTATSFKTGEEVQVIQGDLRGHYGFISDISNQVATIVCKNKQMKNQKIYEPLNNLIKRFKQGERVKIISGADIGKTGIVLTVEEKVVQIWTDNQNSIRVNRKNLEVSKQETICQENVHGLKKDDLIKTSKNLIGIVLETTKDNIKVLDTSNSIQIVNNMDFDSKINSRNIIAKNRIGDQIGSGAEVIIRVGVHESKKCKVLHVYRQNVFLFNPTFTRTAGVSVENAENLTLVSKRQPDERRLSSIKIGSNGPNNTKDEIKIGKVILLRSGPMKGYQGIVKSITKDRIQVRIPSKGCTEWVLISSITTNRENTEVGRTPHRRAGNTHTYVPSSPTKY